MHLAPVARWTPPETTTSSPELGRQTPRICRKRSDRIGGVGTTNTPTRVASDPSSCTRKMLLMSCGRVTVTTPPDYAPGESCFHESKLPTKRRIHRTLHLEHSLRNCACSVAHIVCFTHTHYIINEAFRASTGRVFRSQAELSKGGPRAPTPSDNPPEREADCDDSINKKRAGWAGSRVTRAPAPEKCY